MTHENTDLPEHLSAIVLSYAPPAPPRGGGRPRRRRPGRPAWGIAPIATDPDAWTAGIQRRRMVRAATLSGVMGVAWAGTGAFPAAPPATPKEIATMVDAAVAEDHTDAVPSSPVAFQRGTGPDDEAAGLRAAGSDAASTAPQPSEDADAWRDNVIATWKGVEIVQPSPHVRMVGFHEGGSRADDVRPGARPHRDLGEQPVTSAARRDELPSMVLPGRGRGTGATTAIDIAMPEGRKVFSPITGTVTAANGYALYGKHADTILTIQPDGHPEIMMEILHVTGPRVEVGDRVVAGRTVIADSANVLPFPSQIDRYVTERGTALPHVHIEMQRL